MNISMPNNLGPVKESALSSVSSVMASRKSKPVALDFAKVDSEIRAGLKNERTRLETAWNNRQWYEGDLKAFLSEMALSMGLREETVQTTNMMKTWVDLMTKYLYAGVPQREIPDDPAMTEYLNRVYSQSNFDSIMEMANRYAIIGGVAAVQVEVVPPADEDETNAFLNLSRPAVRHRVWPADQFVVWVHPDHPTLPWAVGVIDYYDNQRRLRVWTSDRLVTYSTKKYDPANPWDGTAYYLVSEEENFLGFVPFGFVWWQQPTTEFWTKGPGDEMQMFQAALTLRLWKQNDDILAQRPILQARNVRSDFVIPNQYKAGTMLRLQPVMDQLGDGAEPTIEYAYCDLSYLTLDWEQLEKAMKLFADSHGLPESAWRLESGAASSGAQVVTEQGPLIDEAERRHAILQRYERDLAIVTLYAASQYLGQETLALDENFDLAINWGKLVKSRPGQELDAHAQFLLMNNLESVAGVIAMLDGITLEQAREKLAIINEDRKAQATADKEITDITQPPDQMGMGGNLQETSAP